MEKMKVVAITDYKKTSVLEIDKPTPKPNQVLIHLHACALCTFEQRVFSQVTKKALPYVGGHECAGIIEAIGEDVIADELPIGQKVAVRVLNHCGTCYYCRHGQENLCKNSYKKSAASAGQLLPNGLGEYLCVDANQVYKLANDLPYEQAVFVEPFACVLNSIERGQIQLGDDVVVIGGGVMGILHVIAAKLSGARVILSEPDVKRAQMAKEYGCDVVINPLETDPVEEVKKLTDGEGANVVFNTTPISAVASQAIAMTAQMGRCVMYSSMHPDNPIEVSPNYIHNTEIVLTGSKSPSIKAFDTSSRILSKRIVDLTPLLTESYSMEDADTAFERAMSAETYRVMIKW
ncbi:MAG: zinc-binding dehydrogenase [Erysipelotrichaceae bacterium]